MTDEVSKKDGKQAEEVQKEGVCGRMFRRRESDEATPTPAVTPEPSAQPAAVESEEESDANFWKRMRKGLGKTRESLGKGMADLLVGAKEIDDEIFVELDMKLLMADVGDDATDIIIQSVIVYVGSYRVNDAMAMYVD